MGRIANIVDLPLDQKFFIAAAFLSVIFLSRRAVERGEPEETVRKETLEFLEREFGSEKSESKVNSLLKDFLDSHIQTF